MVLCEPFFFSSFFRLNSGCFTSQLAAYHEVHQRPVRSLPARGDTHQQEEEDPGLQGALLHILHTSHRPLVRASFNSSWPQTDPHFFSSLLRQLQLQEMIQTLPGLLKGQSSYKLGPSLALFLSHHICGDGLSWETVEHRWNAALMVQEGHEETFAERVVLSEA